MSKVIVTGASGFIGRELIKKLRLISSLEVLPVSRSKKDRSHIHVSSYREAPSGDILVHLAEPSDRSIISKFSEIDLLAINNDLQFLLKKNYQAIIYCSSSVVYGNFGSKPFLETKKIKPYDHYSSMKLNSEQQILKHNGIVARISNVIGHGMSKKNVLSDILSQFPGEGNIYLKNIKPIRDFIAIEDVVDGLITMILNGGKGIYNIGSSRGVSIEELSRIVLEAQGCKAREIRAKNLHAANSYNVLNIDKMKKTFNWTPKITIEEKIKELI
jgi:UDP-glucose 4-epimerase